MKKNKKKFLNPKKPNGGVIYNENSFDLIREKSFLKKYESKINLILTSPPFALNNQKSYGNHEGNSRPNASNEKGGAKSLLPAYLREKERQKKQVQSRGSR